MHVTHVVGSPINGASSKFYCAHCCPHCHPEHLAGAVEPTEGEQRGLAFEPTKGVDYPD